MNEVLPIADASTTPGNPAPLTAIQFAELLADRIAGRLAELLGGQAARTDPELIDAQQLAELLGVDISTINRRKAARTLPRHIELSRGCHRWRLAEVRAWIAAGCPPITEWETRRRAEKGGPR
jgi:predicted DNA-binding transcriptional regulator AlpA